ncbi:MAG: hypothetical protein WCT05_04825 [Lentisphaeria bacterium]
MNRILSSLLAILALSLTGCRTSYIDTLHNARIRIYNAVCEDGTLQQCNLNAGSNIAMHLACDETIYWEGKLMEMDIAVPDWRKRLEKIAREPTGYEGGSMAPLVRHMRLYDYADGIATELKTMYFKKKKKGAGKNSPQDFP